MAENPVFPRRFDHRDRTKLTDAAYQELRSAIVELRFRPGDVLRESAIGRDPGISKTPVREALLKLEQDGLVELVPFRGAQVSGYDADDVKEIFDLRAILEGECARHAAAAADPALLTSLRANVADSRAAHAAGDIDRLVGFFDGFDGMLLLRLGNRRLSSFMSNLQAHMMRIGKLTTEIPGRIEASIEEHAAIVEAIDDGDPARAQSLMRAHIASVRDDQIAAISALVAVADGGPSAVAGPAAAVQSTG